VRQVYLVPLVLAVLYCAGSFPALADDAAPPRPYKPITITLPPREADPSLDGFRKELAEIAQKKDRAALAGKVVSKGFFWQREDSDGAQTNKSGIDNLAAALGLDAADDSGWQVLAGYVSYSSAPALPEMKGVICSPAMPSFDETEMEKLAQTTHTDAADWAYPTADGTEVRAKPEASAPLVEKLALVMIRIMPDENASGGWVKVITPSGKAGYVGASALAPAASDQLCYQKEAGAWKIAGYIGFGAGQE